MGRASSLAGLALAATLLAAPASAAGVPPAVAARVEAAAEQGRLAPGEAESLQRLLAGLQAAGLPTAPFAAKIEEGLAKVVPGPVMVRALERMRGDFVFARETLTFDGVVPPEAALEEAGESLRLGLTREELTALVASRGPSGAEMVARAARVQALLAGIGFPRQAAAELTRTGLAHASLSPSWGYLSKTVLQARERGIPDDRVAEAARSVLAESGSYNDFLTGIGFTTRQTREKAAVPAK